MYGIRRNGSACSQSTESCESEINLTQMSKLPSASVQINAGCIIPFYVSESVSIPCHRIDIIIENFTPKQGFGIPREQKEILDRSAVILVKKSDIQKIQTRRADLAEAITLCSLNRPNYVAINGIEKEELLDLIAKEIYIERLEQFLQNTKNHFLFSHLQVILAAMLGPSNRKYFELLNNSSKRKNIYAQYQRILAQLSLPNAGSKHNKAWVNLRKLAYEKNYLEAKYAIGRSNLKHSNPLHREEARDLLQQTAQAGHTDAKRVIADCSLTGILDFPQNIGMARQYYLESAEKGNIDAKFFVGESTLYQLHGFGDNKALSRRYLFEISSLVDKSRTDLIHEAQHLCARAYIFGENGTALDQAKGKSILIKLTQEGHIKSQCLAGQLFSRGGINGFEKDVNLGLNYLQMAAKAGHKHASDLLENFNAQNPILGETPQGEIINYQKRSGSGAFSEMQAKRQKINIENE